MSEAPPIADSVTAVILAGGQGTRLRSALPDLPKPMAPVAGRPFLEWILRFLTAQGIRKTIISTGYRAEVINDYFSQPQWANSIQCVAEREPLGTAGGFLYAVGEAKQSSKNWLVLNGDSLILANLEPFIRLLDDPDVDVGLLALWVEEAARFGSLVVDDRDQLLGFREKRSGSSWINAGIYLIRNRTILNFPHNRPLSWETEVFPNFLKNGVKVKVLKVKDPFLDIGLPETLLQAEEFISTNSAAFTLE